MDQTASMASRSSSTSEGEVVNQNKANTTSQRGEQAINDSGRVFGLDGTSDRSGKAYFICPIILRLD